jgi:hypothetical protein
MMNETVLEARFRFDMCWSSPTNIRGTRSDAAGRPMIGGGMRSATAEAAFAYSKASGQRSYASVNRPPAARFVVLGPYLLIMFWCGKSTRFPFLQFSYPKASRMYELLASPSVHFGDSRRSTCLPDSLIATGDAMLGCGRRRQPRQQAEARANLNFSPSQHTCQLRSIKPSGLRQDRNA